MAADAPISLRYRLEYAAFCGVAAILRALPIEMASNVSAAVWRLIAPRLSRHRRALTHLRLAFPEKTEAERDAIARGMWEMLGRIFAEFFHLPELLSGDRVIFEDEEAFVALQEPGRACIACAPHQGNWEIVALPLLRRGLRPTGVYQKIKNPLVDRAVRDMRAGLYPGGLLEKNTTSGRAILRHARGGGSVATLADLRDSHGIRVPFFGRLAPSNVFPATLARSLNVPLYVASVVREPGVRFRILVRQVPVPVTDDRQGDIALATARVQTEFERTIRLHPEQWMWAHRRWG